MREPAVRIPPEAERIANELIERLVDDAQPQDDALLALADRFLELCIDADPRAVTCTKGCANCCSQQVFDVHAHEVVRIARFVEDSIGLRSVQSQLDARVRAYDRVRLETPRRPREGDDEWIERVALRFWQLEIPCVFLNAEGECGIHPVRPWSCRRSFAFGPAELCRAETASHPEREAFLLEPHVDFEKYWARLDEHVLFDADTDRLDLAVWRWIESRSENSST